MKTKEEILYIKKEKTSQKDRKKYLVDKGLTFGLRIEKENK
jgi:hypothetical protein